MRVKHIDICVLVRLGCCNQNTIDWMGYEQQKCISHGSGGWKSAISVPARLSEGSLLSRRLHSVSSHGRTGCELSGISYKCTHPIHSYDLIISPRPHLLNHHLWGLRLQPVIPEGHSDHSSMWRTSMARWQHPHGQLSVAFSYVAWSWPNPYSSPGNFPTRYSSPSSLSNVFILYVFLLPGGESKDTFGNFWMGLHHHQNCMMVRENLTEPSKTVKAPGTNQKPRKIEEKNSRLGTKLYRAAVLKRS